MKSSVDASIEEVNQGVFPSEIYERIFAMTDCRTTHSAMSACRFFNSSLQGLRFRHACQFIENDRNYLPHVTNQALMDLVRNANGSAKHHPTRNALAIKHYRDVIVNDELMYRFYQIFIAGKQYDPGSMGRVWGIDDTGFIRVAKETAKLTFHGIDHVSKELFNVVLNHHNPYNFLNHTNPDQNEDENNNINMI